LTSANTIFTLRAIRPSVRQKLEVESKRHFSSKEVESAGHTRTTQPHRGQSLRSFRVVGRREFNNVIGNQRKQLIDLLNYKAEILT
jgi:hypothetical protein